MRLEGQPVILNYRFDQADKARNVARRDMCLRECLDCGLIFNATLDDAAMMYDQNYENRQGFSGMFRSMLEHTAERLIDRHGLRHGCILEVGCGKGDFLRLITSRAEAKGLGYDTSCEQEGWTDDGRICFFKRYVNPEDVADKLDLVICRHVVEHVHDIGDFFRLLHAIAKAGNGAPVYVETPAFEWCVEHEAFWDVFYEHCNYFPVRTLRRIAEQAGFHLLDHRLIFGGQYQVLELSPNPPANAAPRLAGLEGPILKAFEKSLTRSRAEIERKLNDSGAAEGWAIWGAGAKGVSLASSLQALQPAFVVDANPAKQGMFLPGTGIPVISPLDDAISDVRVVLVANANYLPEIENTLRERRLDPILLTV